MIVKIGLVILFLVLLASGALMPAFGAASEWVAGKASAILLNVIEDTQQEVDRQRHERERKEHRQRRQGNG